jgi:pyrroline-5-carboxylate reductase
MDRVLQIVGGGRMGEALLGGLIAGGRAAESLAVVEVFAQRREQLSAAHPGVRVVAGPVAAPDALTRAPSGSCPSPRA